jgi:hypothetical protein
MRHQDLVYNHVLESWTYPNALARTGASGFVTGDIGRIAYQQDTKQYWRLISTTPAWEPITGIFSLFETGPYNPAATTSATLVMMGLGTTLIPSLSGKVLVFASGGVRNDTIGLNGGQIQLYYGTGTAPGNGAPVVGTAVSPAILWRNSPDSSGCIFPFTLVGITTGPVLQTGTTYWFDIALLSTAGAGSAQISSTHFTMVELP